MSEFRPSAADARFTDSVPKVYDRHLGPLLFVEYARDLAARLTTGGHPAAMVLEVAAGTGILTRELAQRLPANATIVATDLNPPMLAVARKKLEGRTAGARIEWREADATSLPFPDKAFDAVVCQFGVMFFPDKPLAASETYRVLAPGGRWLFNVWGSLEENPVARIAHETVTSFFTDDPPQFYKVPFSMYDARSTRKLVTDAGFTDVSIVPLHVTTEAPTAMHAAIGLVRGNPILAAIEERGTVGPDEIIDAVAAALARDLGDNPMRAPMLAYVVSGRKAPE